MKSESNINKNTINVKSKILEYPIDTIVETDKHIVIGSYKFGEKRIGKVQFLDKFSKNLEFENSTSGTFCIFNLQNLIYSANSEDISIYNADNLIKKIETTSINTCIDFYIQNQKYLVVSNTSGYIEIYDESLKFIKKIKISNDTVWIVKNIRNRIYIGTEEGLSFVYDIINDNLRQFGTKRSGIIDFLEMNNCIYVSSYDQNIEIFEIESLNKIKTILNVGAIWKMINRNNLIYCSCIYDGMRIFDKDFNLKFSIPTNSICYGLCVIENEVVWSSFYDLSLFWIDIADLRIL